MNASDNHIEFSTGKRKYCFAAIIGLDDGGNVTYGYDGGIYKAGEEQGILEPHETLTKEELVELADFMIERWTAFRAAHSAPEK